jgi:hypothetical protein
MKKSVSIRMYYTPYLFLFTHLDFRLISRTCYASLGWAEPAKLH